MSNKIIILQNCLKAIINYKRKKSSISNPPLTFWIEPTNMCNLKCIMCPNPKIPKQMLGFMKWDIYKTIIDQIKDYTAAVELLFAGESLLHKDIIKMIKYAKSHNIQVILSTNGVLLGRQKIIDGILDSGLDRLNIAFDGYNAKTYEKIRVGAKYEAVRKNVAMFLDKKKNRGIKKPYVVITTLEVGLDDYADKENDKNAFYSSFNGLPVDEFLSKEPNTWGGYFRDTNIFQHQRIHKEVFNPCSHLWVSLSICWDGTVVPCCFDFFKSYTLGDVNEKTILEIWNDDRIVKLRKSMLDKTYLKLNKLCDKCVILHTKSVFGIPAGMRSGIRYSMTKQLGFRIEKLLIKFASWVGSDYSLKVVK